MEIYTDKVNEARSNLKVAEIELELAERQAKEKKGVKGIERWVGYEFESSSSLTPEFAQFRREIKSYIKKSLPVNLELIMPFSSLHFAFSGFIKNKETEKFVYFSSSDVRHFKDSWFDNLLIRTAENEKDYTGGNNDNCKITQLAEKALSLTI